MARAAKPPAPPRRLAVARGVAIVAAVALLGLWASNEAADRARAELVETKRAAASMIVRVFAASLAAPLDFGDEEGIRAKVAGLSSNEDVLYAAVWQADDPLPLASFGPEHDSSIGGSSETPVLLDTLEPVLLDTLEIVERVKDPTARDLGSVKVTFTLLPELRRYQSTRNRGLLISGLLTLLVSAALLWFGKRSIARVADAPGPTRIGLPQEFYPLGKGPMHGPSPGDVLGHYQLLTCVGQGGMGRVWAARHLGAALQRLVAIKTAIESDEQPHEHRSLFIDEARIALLIRHPNVCGVYELGDHQGALYQVMEWCDGASLRQVLDQLPNGRMAFGVAARVAAKVGAGLHAAHELEDEDGVRLHVVHRDVSPQNILISTSGQVKVTDFGVAKAHGQLHRPTATGEVKGKLSYMAPEQVMGREVDRRADIFALACVLYEATTGKSPFAGEGALSTLYQLLSQPVAPPSVWVSDYPEDLANLVLKGLAREPSERFETAEQFAVALESWLAGVPLVVTEQMIAEVVVTATGAFIQEKSRRVEHAISLMPDAIGFEPELLVMPVAASVMPPRPTVPAGPAARKPGAAQ